MSASNEQSERAKIRALNDAFRKTLSGGRIMMTAGVAALPASIQKDALANVQSYTAFSNENDPYGEHDLGAFEIAGQEFFWKIDYYDREMHFASDDPSNPDMTARVMTIMLAEEY